MHASLEANSQPKLGPASRLMHMCRREKQARNIFLHKKELRTNSGQARPGIITQLMTHAINATLAPTCMLHAQCMAILEAERVSHNPMCPASRLMHMCRREKQARNMLTTQFFCTKRTEDKLRPGQARNNHTTHDTCNQCNSGSHMHVACSMHMAILEAERVSHNPRSCKQTHAHVQKEKQAKNTFFQRR